MTSGRKPEERVSWPQTSREAALELVLQWDLREMGFGMKESPSAVSPGSVTLAQPFDLPTRGFPRCGVEPVLLAPKCGSTCSKLTTLHKGGLSITSCFFSRNLGSTL